MTNDIEENCRKIDCQGIAEQAPAKNEVDFYSFLSINSDFDHVFVFYEILRQFSRSGVDQASIFQETEII